MSKRDSASGTESQEYLHGTMRGSTGGDDRICVLERAIQQATLQRFLRGELGKLGKLGELGELKVGMDVGRSCHREE